MTSDPGQGATPRPTPTAPRRRRWRRWVAAGLVLLVVIVVASAAVVSNAPVPPPLGLPATAAAPPTGPLDGTWQVTGGSVAGLRIRQTVLAMTSDVVGRTEAVTGTVVLSGGRVTSATFRVDLTSIRFSGKEQKQLGLSLDTEHHPLATATLESGVDLGPAFASGAVASATAPGTLDLRGSSHPVTVDVTGRRDGAEIEIAGHLEVPFADWGIPGPQGFGILGSLADRATAEFLLVLRRA